MFLFSVCPNAGVVYGYSGLLPVLLSDARAFAHRCAAGESVPCGAQVAWMTAAYTASEPQEGTRSKCFQDPQVNVTVQPPPPTPEELPVLESLHRA